MPTHHQQIILAKKPKNPENPQYRETLLGHTEDVINSFKYLFGEKDKPTRLGEKWLSFFQLDPNNDWQTFCVNTHAACVLHDIGKANSGFQDALIKNSKQVVRHEHLSGAIVFSMSMQEAIKKIKGIDFDILITSIIGHHLKCNKENFLTPLTSVYESFQIYPDIIEKIFNLVCLNQISLNGTMVYWTFNENYPGFQIKSVHEVLKSKLKTFFKELKKNPYRKQLLWSVRTALIISDSAGSGLTRENHDLKKWIEEAFSTINILDGNSITEKVIKPRIKQIYKNNEFNWKGFQKGVDDLPERSLLVASCGSGKTLAAWRWIEKQATRQPVSRVIFLYPTRATATEGFRDYVSWAPESDASLLHGTSEYELEGMFHQPDDNDKENKNFTVEERLFAIAYWKRYIFSATVDQFLGFMQYSYKSVCLLPLISDSIIVFDEVHSFDRSLFSTLKKFLNSFNVPVLCMTASLPTNRRTELEKCGMTIYPTEPEKINLSDYREVSQKKRYSISTNYSREDLFKICVKENFCNKKILWVVNTVQRCQEISNLFTNSICYHSRFKLDDRKARHEELITKFKEFDGPLICITTQVCEMSLDLDADILITEVAPITSLIQRMGRCNRHDYKDSNRIGDVFIYNPDNIKPYNQKDLENVDHFINEINNSIVSQDDLSNLLEKYSPKLKELEKYNSFTDGGPWAQSREQSLRDESDYTVPSILDSDIEYYTELQQQRKPTDGLILNVPKSNVMIQKDSRIPHWLNISPSANYDIKLGFIKEILDVFRY